MAVPHGFFDLDVNSRPRLVVSKIDHRAFYLAIVMVGNS
jgi:hypothetical protein